MTILAITRQTDFSPNHVDNDAAIMHAVVKRLQEAGYATQEISESEFSRLPDADVPRVIIHMARRPDTLQRLASLADRGYTIFNNPTGVLHCSRESFTSALVSAGVPTAESCIVETADSWFASHPDSHALFPGWLKLADGYARRSDDVVYVSTPAEADSCLAAFRKRGISKAVFNRHLHGDLVKFYGVAGTDFFHWTYPQRTGHSKFGLETRNDPVRELNFNQTKLQASCNRVAKQLGVSIYGGDCIVGDDGVCRIIDFNDWPSFAPCRDEAAHAIADIVMRKARYQATLKHPDTEETIDLLFYRPLGYRMACLAERLGVTPNAISVLSIFLGVGAGILCFPQVWWLNVLGLVLLVLADICDSADGQLARMTGRFSRLGRILDGVCGDLWFIAIYVAICCRLTDDWDYAIWILAAAAGGCHALQAAMADYYRNFHLFFVKGRSGSELEDARQVDADFRAIRFRTEPLYKVFMFFYRNYTREQEFFTPQMQRLRLKLRQLFGEQPVPAPLCAAFRFFSLPLMKYTNILSFNCRAIMLSVTLLCDAPWLYFVGELTLFNLILIYMIVRHELICRRFAKRLEATA